MTQDNGQPLNNPAEVAKKARREFLRSAKPGESFSMRSPYEMGSKDDEIWIRAVVEEQFNYAMSNPRRTHRDASKP